MLQRKNSVLESKGKGLYFRVKGQNCYFKCSLVFLRCNLLMLEPECFTAGEAGVGRLRESLQVGVRPRSGPSVQHHVCTNKSTAYEGIT